MFPKTRLGEKKHRHHKRELEISLAIETISHFLKNNPDFETRRFSILEFGSGNGFQVPYLQQIGDVVASDISTSDGIKDMGDDVSYCECSVTNAPFGDSQFDLVFSNHVIEHIGDLNTAFDELRRIGRPDCIYAFSVPTNIWLLVSIPAKYYNKTRAFIRRLLFTFSGSRVDKPVQNDDTDNNLEKRANSTSKKLLRRILPRGHGVHSDFIDCYLSFRIRKWQQLFSDSGFSVIRTQPLLLYSASEWPIVPTTKLFNRVNVCSSVLFLMQKA